MSIADDIYEAMTRVGRDGKGKEGAVGYLMWVAGMHPKLFVRLLIEILRQGDYEPEPVQEPRDPREAQRVVDKLKREYEEWVLAGQPLRDWKRTFEQPGKKGTQH